MPATCQTVINALEEIAPSRLAEGWDNIGLLIGSPVQPIQGIIVTLDVDSSVVQFAIERGANLIVAHHPVIFKGITSIRQDTPTGKLLYQLIRHNIAVIAVHTNLDTAKGGVNDALAAAIGLQATTALLSTHSEKLYKLAVFVPEQYLEFVRNAIAEAGAGHIGLYSHCSFSAKGEGTFMPLAASRPFIGAEGQLEKVIEYKLETILPEGLCHQTISAMLSAHPYEEVAYDLYPLINQGPSIGIGRIGRLSQPMRLDAFAAMVKERLRTEGLKIVGPPDAIVSTIAVCGGSGASLTAQAKQAGADVLVTGDVKYHEAQQAEAQGLLLVDAGHFATEYPVVDWLANYLATSSIRDNWGLTVCPSPGKDVFWSI